MYVTLTIATIVTQWCIFFLHPHFIKCKHNHKYQFTVRTPGLLFQITSMKLPPFDVLQFMAAQCNFIKYHWFISSASIWNHVLEVRCQRWYGKGVTNIVKRCMSHCHWTDLQLARWGRWIYRKWLQNDAKQYIHRCRRLCNYVSTEKMNKNHGET